jgi:hypothetical protein
VVESDAADDGVAAADPAAQDAPDAEAPESGTPQ